MYKYDPEKYRAKRRRKEAEREANRPRCPDCDVLVVEPGPCGWCREMAGEVLTETPDREPLTPAENRRRIIAGLHEGLQPGSRTA